MSVAVLATLSAPVSMSFAADKIASNAGIVNYAKASVTLISTEAFFPLTASPEAEAIMAISGAVNLNAAMSLEKAGVVIATNPEAQSNAAVQMASTVVSQITAGTGIVPAGDVSSLMSSSVDEVASYTVSVVDWAIAGGATGAFAPGNNDETTIRAEQMTGRPSRVLNFDGQVEFVRGPSTIDAETAEYHEVEDLVMANRNVQMFRNRDCYTGDTLEMQMDTNEGFLTNPTYKLEKNNAQGFATRMNFIDSDRSEVEHGIYTTCEGVKPDWYMRATQLNLDTGQDEGVAYNGVVYFKDVPILAAPWMSFPISDSRRSGILPPEFYSTSAGGAEIAVPYYLDIAPNRDATIIPKIIERRGEQLGGEYRYIEPDYSGLFHAEINPSDHDDDGKTRYSISEIHNETFFPGLVMGINYNRASDDQYAIDYSHSITASSQHLLPQILNLTYAPSPFWNVGLNMTNYQVLQDANNDIVKPYEITPRIFVNAARIDTYGFDWSLYTEYTNFLNSNPDTVYGERFVEQAQISYPVTGTFYFITPKLLYHFSDYKLVQNNAIYATDFTIGPGGAYTVLNSAPYSIDPSFAVPTFSVDSGLFFERDTSLFGREITQTLEPRLFYVKTPYRYQTDIPIFDTGLADINFAQIFNENRFSGQDRVGDANQLTSALITRAIEMDGQERIRFAIAQRLSFEQPLVVDSPIFYSTNVVGNTTTYTAHSNLPSRSDFIFAGTGKLTNDITLDTGWQYSQSLGSTQQLSYGFKWQPGPMQVVNAEYRYQRFSEVDPEGMKQVDVSAQWPLAPRWYGVARSNFSLQDHRMLDGLAGFEYKQDCWIFRMVAQRYLVPSTVAGVTSSSTTSLFFQLELNGLSKIGTNPLQTIKRSIAGYQPINQPTTQESYQQSNF